MMADPLAHRPVVIAHRGASDQAPENTLAAFRRAVELGVDAVELDVHLSADGVPVVIHDSVLGRTNDGAGLVGDFPLAALRRLDAGRWFGESFAGERIPTLQDALTLLRPMRVVVEIKNGPIFYPEIAVRVVAAVRAAGHEAVTISSFDHPVLREVAAAAPELETAVLFAAHPVDAVRLAADAAARLLHPNWMWTTRAMVEAAHAARLRVEVWGVEEVRHMTHVMGLGVDGIITSHPERLQTLLAGP